MVNYAFTLMIPGAWTDGMQKNELHTFLLSYRLVPFRSGYKEIGYPSLESVVYPVCAALLYEDRHAIRVGYSRKDLKMVFILSRKDGIFWLSRFESPTVGAEKVVNNYEAYLVSAVFTHWSWCCYSGETVI
jgi:hypothetical protein